MPQSDLAGWLARHILPHEPALRRWLRRQLPPDLGVDDVVQETYARLAGLGNHEAIAHPRAYFFQAARSVVLMHMRRSRIVRIEAMAEIRNAFADDAPAVDEALLWQEQLLIFQRHLDEMPETARTAFKLRFWENLSFAQIAERLGISENAAQKNVARNLRILASRMAEGGFRVAEASRGDKLAEKAKSVGSAE